MHGIDDFLIALHQRGVEFSVLDGQIRIEAPRGVLVPEERNKLSALKFEIINRIEQIDLATNTPLRRRSSGTSLFPLTPMQMILWNTLMLWRNPLREGGPSDTRMCVSAARISGPLDTNTLQRCMEFLIRRHESLRTRIVEINGKPGQQVDPPGECRIEIVDLKNLGTAAIDRDLMSLIKDFVAQRVNVATEPLLGVRLFELSRDERVLVLALGHLIADYFSLRVLTREMWTLYSQASAGLSLSLPELPIQFVDYAVWLHRIRSAWFFEHAWYWRQRMSGAPRIQLPIGDGATRVAEPVGAVIKVQFGPCITGQLRNIARQERTQLSLLVLTIYAAVMSQWCRHRDLLLTLVVDGRHHPDLSGMVGDLAYHLHLRIELATGVSFYSLFKQVEAEYSAALHHQDFGWVPTYVPECANSFVNLDLYFNWITADDACSCDVPLQDGNQIRVTEFPLEFDWALKFLPYFVDAGTDIVAHLRHRPDCIVPEVVERFGFNLRYFAEEFVRNSNGSVPSYQF